MRALVLILVCGLGCLGLSPAAAVAQGTSGSGSSAGSAGEDLWGQSDQGEDKGRVQADPKQRPYNTTHIAFAAVIIGAMAVFLIWLIRRNTRGRDSDGA